MTTQEISDMVAAKIAKGGHVTVCKPRDSGISPEARRAAQVAAINARTKRVDGYGNSYSNE